MDIYYTYLIGWSEKDKWYYGVRYGKGSNPEELWKTYFTSSTHVAEWVDENGEPDIIEVRKTFEDPNKARDFEHGVLKRMGVVYDDRWLNKTDNKCFDPELMSEIGKTKTGESNNFYGRKHSKESKRKNSEAKKRYFRDKKNREKASSSTKKGMGKFREQFTDEEWAERYRKIGEKNKISNKGQTPWSKGKKLSDEHKKKIGDSVRKTKGKKK